MGLLKQQHDHNICLSIPAKLRVFLWTMAQWCLIRRMIKKEGFLNACERWKIKPTALSHMHACTVPSDQLDHIPSDIHRMVLRAGKCFPDKRNNCLPRALAAAHWMQHYNIPYRIRIGIRSESKAILTSAHAWIEVNGRAIGELEESIEQLKPLDPYPNHISI